MKITRLFSEPSDQTASSRLPVSFEIFPPKGDLPVAEARDMVGLLAPLDPAFVSVTYFAGGSGNSGKTVDVARMAKDEFGLTVMAHLTCAGETREGIRWKLDEMSRAGIENVLALRGDAARDAAPGELAYACDLIPMAAEAGFCVGAAAYPEGHIDCLDAAENIRHLKAKQDAGASFFVTQLFFDNEFALRFLDDARRAGVSVPITFGIMPFMSKAQISRMVFMCGASLPSPIIKLLARYEDDPVSLRAAGIEYAARQLVGLAEAGVDGLHVYTMNKPDVARAAMAAIRDAGFAAEPAPASSVPAPPAEPAPARRG